MTAYQIKSEQHDLIPVKQFPFSSRSETWLSTIICKRTIVDLVAHISRHKK